MFLFSFDSALAMSLTYKGACLGTSRGYNPELQFTIHCYYFVKIGTKGSEGSI